MPADKTICFRALNVRVFNWLGWRGFVGLEKQNKVRFISHSRTFVLGEDDVDLHSLDSDSPAVLDYDLVHLGVAGQVEVGVDGPGGVNVGVGAIAPATGLYTTFCSGDDLSR